MQPSFAERIAVDRKETETTIIAMEPGHHPRQRPVQGIGMVRRQGAAGTGENQVEHHSRKSFREEYLEFLERFEVPYEDRYLFVPVD